MEDNKIIFDFKNIKPVRLVELADAFSAIADEWADTVAEGQPLKGVEEPELYVTEVRKGSIIAELQPYAIGALDFAISHGPKILTFLKTINSIGNFYRGASTNKPLINKSSLINFQKITTPVAMDQGASLNIYGNNNEFKNCVFCISSNDARTTSNNISEELSQGTFKYNFYEKVTLKWNQARNDIKSKSGDRAIIEPFSPKPVKVTFSNQKTKTNLLRDSSNLFLKEYTVDVVVESDGDNTPISYQILKIYHTD